MSKSTRLQVRMTPETKERANELFESLGLTMSDAVTMFIHESLRIGGIPFTIGAQSSNQSSTVQRTDLKRKEA